MARSDFTYPLATHRAFSSRLSIRRRPTPPSTPPSSNILSASPININPSRSRLSQSNVLRPSPATRVSSVRRSLFGSSNPEDTENMFNFVIDTDCEEFKKVWAFDVKQGRPCQGGPVQWEEVSMGENDEGKEDVSNSGVKQLRPIRLDLLNRSPLPTVNVSEDVEMVPVQDRQRVKEVLDRVRVPESAMSMAMEPPMTTRSGSAPSSQEKRMINNNHIVAPSSRLGRQSVISDFMTPLKRKADSMGKSSKFGNAKAEVAKRAKINDYFKPSA